MTTSPYPQPSWDNNRVSFADAHQNVIDAVTGQGIKINVEHEFAKLRAVVIGSPASLFFVDADAGEIENIAGDSKGRWWFDLHNANANKALKDVDPERYEGMVRFLDELAEAYEANGVKVIRYTLDNIPRELEDSMMGTFNQKFLSGYGKPYFPFVFGPNMVQTHEVAPCETQPRLFTPAISQLLKEEQNKDVTWNWMPHTELPFEGHPETFMSPGDPRIMPGKRILVGMGVDSIEQMNEENGRRTAANEHSIEILRRMVAPLGYTVHSFFYNSKYSCHTDGVLFAVKEGLMAYPDDLIWPGQENLPYEISEWDYVAIDPEEAANGACNSISLGDDRVIIPATCTQLKADLEAKGITVTTVNSEISWETYLSGIHCCTSHVWQED